MASLAARDILHGWSQFLLTGCGLGLLIGVTLSMAGIYRGMVDKAQALLHNSAAELWVVQPYTQGPYAESSSIKDDIVRGIRGMPGVQRAANVSRLTMQERSASGREARATVVGNDSDSPPALGGLVHPVAGRHITRSHYEAVADLKTGFALGERIRIRRRAYTIVGLTRRQVSSGGDPMVFIPLKDAQQAQFRKDNDAIVNDRARSAASPAFNRPGQSSLLEAKLIANSARQIGLFPLILSVVSAAIVAFTLCTMTMGKRREIAVPKHVGTRHRTSSAMILQQALGLGLIGFAVGKIAAPLWAPFVPKYVLLLPRDAVRGLAALLSICALASTVAIRVALKVDPAAANG